MTKSCLTHVARFLTLALFALGLSPCALSDEPEKSVRQPIDPAQLKFFEDRIRPVLVKHCYSCHSADAKSVKGGLLLDSREGLLLGGDSGPSIVPEKPEASLLLQAMRHESLEMPPVRKLPEQILVDFETWIRAGAADPRSGTAVQDKRQVDIEKGREFWSFRPVVKSAVPAAGEGWAINDIDRFIADAQIRRRQNQVTSEPSTAAADLHPADASADVLIRRLTFVLTGLPPTVDEQLQFVKAYQIDSETAISSAIDRLIDSPRFGERWGRHWLDVARYAESTGGGRSLMLPDAWRYRDYVISSFNHDKPFDQLVREQLAGDLLPAADDVQRDEQITGVGYLMLGAINYEEQDKEQLRMDVVDEQIDSMGRSFLGMTLGCCRCHDHKFDPIPTADYYALAGIFRSTKSLTPGNVCGFVTAPLRTGFDKTALTVWVEKDADLERQMAALKASVAGSSGRPDVAALSQLTDVVVDDSDVASRKAMLQKLEEQRKAHAKLKPEIPTVMCVEEEAQPADWHVHIRGEIRNLGPKVPRGFITAATPASRVGTLTSLTSAPTSGRKASGRKELAEWVAAAENPLTARVYVNRIWLHVMGEGIVRTPDNFGETGERPSHPELLDHLAATFVDDGWSTKKLIRRLCLSRTFRQSTSGLPDAAHWDPDNRLLSRANRRRLDAESVRDSLLQISGTLDLTVVSGRTIAKVSTYDNEYQHAMYPMSVRSVFVPSFRNTMLDVFEIFDGANPNLVTGKRTRSTRPAQALYLLNSPFVMEQAKLAATSFLESDSFRSDDLKVNMANVWRRCVSREPTPQEVEAAVLVINDGRGSKDAWVEIFHALFASVDFRYLE